MSLNKHERKLLKQLGAEIKSAGFPMPPDAMRDFVEGLKTGKKPKYELQMYLSIPIVLGIAAEITHAKIKSAAQADKFYREHIEGLRFKLAPTLRKAMREVTKILP